MKILHTADIHLGITTYGRVDPATGLNSRLQDFRRSFTFLVEQALAEDVDLFLFCGDAFRNPDPSPTEQMIFAECLQPLVERGIPLVLLVGNHDHPVTFGRASSIDIFRYLEGQARVFRRPEVATIQTKSGPLQLIALPWPVRSLLLTRREYRQKSAAEVREVIEQLYTEYVQKAVERLDPSLPTILAGHFSVQGAELSGSERTSLIAYEPKFTVGQLALPPIDYVALGHIHRHQNLNPDGIPVVYSSSIERVSFREAEDPKGFVLVEIQTQGSRKQTQYRFVETPARRFVDVQVDARDSDDPTERILNAIGRVAVADAIVRVRYQVNEDQVARIDLRRIREALQAAAHIAGIERTVEPVVREQRTIVERDSSLREALTRYIDQHEQLHPLREQLIEAALALEARLEAERLS
ncbi:metallophosphoesterase family protein [Rhodothermus profundi]|uniref:Nuclease SbcCD subunit D n=1 Tax=Rhodothermus profundi TaxID=633813 RepID=A0A1M6RPF4_9BACT|nr:exonuclease SbcCD subunit D [Rhodothermus profundi]SHK34339.1 Exodeoxyribonuclease I subunit D [Rhodothermus profundi]